DAAEVRASDVDTWVVVDDLLRRRVPILTRLAIWLVHQADDVDADGKLRWCLDGSFLSEPWYRHEVFTLIAGAFPGASEELRTRIWEAGSRPEIEDSDTRTYEAYNFAVWINRVDPGFESASSYLEAASREHPQWEPRTHPDLTWWSEGGWVEADEPPVTKLTGLSYEELREREREVGSEPWAFRFREHVAAAAADSPEWGLSILQGLSQAGDWESELWTAVPSGFTR